MLRNQALKEDANMEKWGTPQPPPPPAERPAYAGSNVPMQCILPPDFIQGSPHVQVHILPYESVV
jgi:hypothetical protein